VLAWLAGQGFRELCAAGISKGGYLATVAGLRSSVPAHVVALLPPDSGVAVLVDIAERGHLIRAITDTLRPH
jgi:hypothetical protein